MNGYIYIKDSKNATKQNLKVMNQYIYVLARKITNQKISLINNPPQQYSYENID